MRWSAADVVGFATGAGWTGENVVTATAIALATSGGDDRFSWTVPGAGGFSRRGLWGLDVAAIEFPDTGNLGDPRVNARAAFGLWKANGETWDSFPAFVTGSYRASVDAARRAYGAGPTHRPVPPAGQPAQLQGRVSVLTQAAARAAGALSAVARGVQSLRP